jgi:hypothetical protein
MADDRWKRLARRLLYDKRRLEHRVADLAVENEILHRLLDAAWTDLENRGG